MKRILVIDDDNQMKSNLKEVLELLNFNPIIAQNSLEGINLAQKTLPDLIICDVSMPQVNGYEVLKILKENPATVNIPFIFLTGKCNIEDMRMGMNHGADDYLIKPFTMDDLELAISTRLKRKELINQEIETKLEELRYNISAYIPHELNTPLNGIIGSAQLLQNFAGQLDEQQIKEMGDIIFSSGQRLHNTIKNFLLYCELQVICDNPEKRQQFKEKRSYCNPKSILTEVSTALAEKSERKKDLKFDLVDKNIRISETHFHKIVTELVDNALKFSRVNTPIEIFSEIRESMYHLHVVDYGRGMSEEDIKNIGGYMQFGREKYEQQGLGLGLVIAQKIADLYDAQLILDSILNEKTTITLVVPLVDDK